MLVYKKINISVSGVSLRSLIFSPLNQWTFTWKPKTQRPWIKHKPRPPVFLEFHWKGRKIRVIGAIYSSFSLQVGYREKRNICGDWEWSKGGVIVLLPMRGTQKK